MLFFFVDMDIVKHKSSFLQLKSFLQVKKKQKQHPNMISDLLLYCAVSLLLYGIYKWFTKKNDYFEKRGVSFMKPKSIFQIISDLSINQKSMVDFMNVLYTVNPGHK